MHNFKKINFLISSIRTVGKFGIKVKEGKVTESEFNVVFKKIKQKKYTEKEASIVVKNLLFASSFISSRRTDYEIPSNEALLHVLKYVNIKGSANLKVLYSLLRNMTKIKKNKNNKKHFVCRKKISKIAFKEFRDRINFITNTDKELKITKEILTAYEDLKEKIKKLSLILINIIYLS